MAENVIEITNVTKRFGSAEVLKNVSINFEKGKIHGLIGRNGSGKTMLMKCICGFVPVSEGRILVEGKQAGKYSLGMRQRLGLAQAIMEDPRILLLDEPMNGLDKHGVEEMRELFKTFADSGKTIIMANHSAEDIEVLCDTVHEMDLGVITRVK